MRQNGKNEKKKRRQEQTDTGKYLAFRTRVRMRSLSIGVFRILSPPKKLSDLGTPVYLVKRTTYQNMSYVLSAFFFLICMYTLFSSSCFFVFTFSIFFSSVGGAVKRYNVLLPATIEVALFGGKQKKLFCFTP